jgi:hypothetical protein
MKRPVEKVLRCDCGFEVRASSEPELLERVQSHACEVHGMEFTDEQVLLLAFRAELEAGPATAELPGPE